MQWKGGRRVQWGRLTIPGWPPAVSHLGAFALGIMVAGLFRSAEEAPMKVPAKSVVIAMENDGLAGMDSLTRGNRVHAVRRFRMSGQAECLISKDSGVMVQGRPRLAAAFGQASARLILDALSRLEGEAREKWTVSLAGEKSIEGLDRCLNEPRVVYGEE